MENLTKQFERQVAVFLRRSRLTPSQLGVRSVGDTKFLGDMRRGRSPRLATADRVLEFMDAYSRAHGLDRSGDPSTEPGQGRPGDTHTSENRGEEEA
ncbi:MAG: hypothetical protein OXI46_07250 [Gemmatimonadota bacterium]|nr:hypothetical protein [Gemmatimonadota bacterium]